MWARFRRDGPGDYWFVMRSLSTVHFLGLSAPCGASRELEKRVVGQAIFSAKGCGTFEGVTEPDGADPVHDGLSSPDEPEPETRALKDISTYQRLNEFGWNALPAYLAVLGALFLIFGVSSGALRHVAYGALFIGLAFVTRRHDGAWFRRY